MGLRKRYEAAMVLSGVGDALGYKKGDWEFCRVGYMIHEQLQEMGGVNSISVCKDNWPVSDDTVMHIATGKALVPETSGEVKEELYSRLAREYIECMKLMVGRGPGVTSVTHTKLLDPEKADGHVIPFNERGGGCGAAMRAMCIGLRYPDPADLQELICVSIESGRMTHHHPTGYLGALAAALFTSFAIQGKPLISWGCDLVNTLPKALEYVCETNREVEQNKKAWGYFGKRWKQYLEERGISDGKSRPKFAVPYGVDERDDFYKKYSYYNGCGGHSGHDAPMIAYDALLGFNGTWTDLCNRAMFHGGDSDSTGVIAGCLFGAMFGYKGVRRCNYSNLEFREELINIARGLYRLSHPGEAVEDSHSCRKCVIA